MGKIEIFEDLECWQYGKQLATFIYTLSSKNHPSQDIRFHPVFKIETVATFTPKHLNTTTHISPSLISLH